MLKEKQMAGRAEWWRKFTVVVCRRKRGEPRRCYLKCNSMLCGALLVPSNPARTAKEHFTKDGCPGERQRRCIHRGGFGSDA